MKRVYLAASIALVAGLAFLFGWSNFFTVKKVTIGISDAKVVNQIEGVLAQPPAAISIGEKLARVDKRVIAGRLKSLAWIDRAWIYRNFITGEVKISLTSRRPIARFAGNSASVKFLAENLETFSLTGEAITSATRTNSFEWKALPIIDVANPSDQNLSDVKSFIEEIAGQGLVIKSIEATSPDEIVSVLSLGSRMVEVRWGSVHELKIKKRVLDALLAAPENKKVKSIDLSDPQNPTVK